MLTKYNKGFRLLPSVEDDEPMTEEENDNILLPSDFEDSSSLFVKGKILSIQTLLEKKGYNIIKRTPIRFGESDEYKMEPGTYFMLNFPLNKKHFYLIMNNSANDVNVKITYNIVIQFRPKMKTYSNCDVVCVEKQE